MKAKRGFEAGAYSKASLLIANAHNRYDLAEYSIIAMLVTVLAVAASLTGLEIFQPVFADSFLSASTTTDSVSMSGSNVQQTATGNSYFRSMSESMSVIAGNGNPGNSLPASYQRSMSESLSLTTIQGKVPNSYSRSLSEQASLTTGMPSSGAPAASQPARTSLSPYSAGSNQRIEERYNQRSLIASKADTTNKGPVTGAPVFSSDSAASKPGLSVGDKSITIQNMASADGSEGEIAEHSSAVRYVLSNIAASQYNAGYSQVNFVIFGAQGLIIAIVALYRSKILTTAGRKVTTTCGAGTNVAAVGRCPAQTALQTRIILILLILFSASAMASISSPIFGQAAADTNAAGAAYRSNSGTSTLNSPKYREYTAGAGTWSAEVELPSVGQNVRSIFLLFNPINSQRVIISYDTNGDIDLFRCSAGCTSTANWYNVGTVATTQSYGTTNPYLPVCAAYEHTSGRLVVVYDKPATEANDFYYRTFDGSSLSNEVGFNYIGAGASDAEEIRYCDMSSNPKSGLNELALVVEDATNTDAYAFIWDATANSNAGGWTNQRTVTLAMGATAVTGNAAAVGYESSSGAAVAVAGAGNNAMGCERWTGSWATVACGDWNGNGADQVKFIHAYSDPVYSSDRIMFCRVDSLNDIVCNQINGNTWGTATVHSATGDGANTHSPFSFAWDPSGSIGHVFYETSGAADTTVTWKSWTASSSTWGGATTLAVASSVHNWFYAATNPTDTDTLDKLFIKINSLFDGGVIRKNAGSNPTLVGEQTLTNDQTVVTFEHQADIAFQLSTAAPSFPKQLTEQLTIVASLGRSAVLKRAESEQLVVINRIIKGISSSAHEQLLISASATASQLLTRTTSGQLSLQDNIAIKVTKPLAEQIMLTENSPVSSSKLIIEQFGVTDNSARLIAPTRMLNEQLIVGEKLSIAITKSLSEQLSLQVKVAPSIMAITEPLAITDKLVKAVSKTTVESLVLHDLLSRSANQSRSFSEGLTIKDSIMMSVTRSLSEQFIVTESATRSTITLRNLSEQMNTFDFISRLASSTRIEHLAVQDIINGSRTVDRSFSESLGITETLARKSVQSSTFNEGFSLADLVASSLVYSRSLTDDLSISDTTNLSSLVLTRSMSEQMNLQANTILGAVRFEQDQLSVSDSTVTSQVLTRQISDQLGMIDIAAGRSLQNSIAEQLSFGDSLTAFVSSKTVELLAVTDHIISSTSFTRKMSDNFSIVDSISRPTSVAIIESLNLQDSFTNIAASFRLSLAEMLLLPDSIITNQVAQFNYVSSHTITIGDSIILLLQSGKIAATSESIHISDRLGIFIVTPAPTAPTSVTNMPNLTIADAESLGLNNALSRPLKALNVNGLWNITALDNQGLKSLLNSTGMPVYDINAEASSVGIDQMTIILPAFRVYTNTNGIPTDDVLFLTPTLSRLPAGIHVIVPIDAQASMNGAQNLDQLGNITLRFTPTENVDNFTMMISLLDNNPRSMTHQLPANLAAFYINISIVGDFGSMTPDNPAFFQQSPKFEFTLHQDWAQMHNIKRDLNGVPIIGIFLLDDASGQWVVGSSNIISSPPSSSGSSYAYTITLLHFSTYVLTANREITSSSGGHSHAAFSVPLTESLLMTSGMNSGSTIGSEGKVVFKDITENFALSIGQPKPLHKRIISIHDVSVAISVSDIRSAIFGTAIATLDFEITNKGAIAEKLLLKYWYTDPISGIQVFEKEETVVVQPGQVMTRQVEIPFNSNGIYDVTIEAGSEDGTVATTDLAVNVPWLDVYLYPLVVIAIIIVLISIIYVIRAMRGSRLFIMGDK